MLHSSAEDAPPDASMQSKPLCVYEWARMQPDDSKYCYLCETVAEPNNPYRQILIKIAEYKLSANLEFLFTKADEYFTRNIQPYTATKQPFPARAIYRHFVECDKKDKAWVLLEDLAIDNEYNRQYRETGRPVDPSKPDTVMDPNNAHIGGHVKILGDRRKILDQLSEK
jgi:hypothetical protein